MDVELPGTPVADGFTYRRGESLSSAARQRVLDMLDASNDARRRAAVDAQTAIVG